MMTNLASSFTENELHIMVQQSSRYEDRYLRDLDGTEEQLHALIWKIEAHEVRNAFVVSNR